MWEKLPEITNNLVSSSGRENLGCVENSWPVGDMICPTIMVTLQQRPTLEREGASRRNRH